MTDAVVVPSARDVRAVLDSPDAASACVVACPPHPQLGGSRADSRLTAVSNELVKRGIACLRFDYGPWDEGYGECSDATDALAWALDRYGATGIFGYSFGGAVALLAAARESGGSESDVRRESDGIAHSELDGERKSGLEGDETKPGHDSGAPESELDAVSALAPAARLTDDLDAVEALDGVDCPGQVVYGERDETVDWEPVVERARERGFAVESIRGDHHFVGQTANAAEVVATFFADEFGHSR